MRFTTLFVMSVVALCSACEEKPAATSAPAIETKPALVAKKEEAPKPLVGAALANHYVACWSAYSDAKWDKLGACYADDAVSEFPDSGQEPKKGKSAIMAEPKSQRAAFPDQKGAPELVLVNGRNVVSVAHIAGTNSGPMMNPDGTSTPATNKKIGQNVFHAVTFNDANLVANETFIQDVGSMMSQLGLSPAPGRAAVANPSVASPPIVVAKNDAQEKANVALVEKSWADMAKEDLKAMEATLADDVVEADQAAPADLTGKSAVLANAKMFMGAMSDFKNTCSTWGAGEYVVSNCKVQATNDGDMGRQFKKTGRTVNLSVVEISKIADGKFSKIWRFYNGMAFAQQLGLIPEQPAATAKGKEPAASPGAVKPVGAKVE